MSSRKFISLTFIVVGILLGFFLSQIALAEVLGTITNQADIGKLLGWVPNKTNLCRGSFQQPITLEENKNPPPLETLPSQISAAGPTLFTRDGPSILTKNVVYSQPGRLATADRAVIYRDPNTGKLQLIHLSGNVHLLEYGILIIGPKGDLDLATGELNFGPNIAYHILESPERFHFQHSYDGWGQASTIERHPNGIIDLYHATYTTCAPETHPDWQLVSKHVQLDHDHAVGHAYNSFLKFKGIPVFYLPWYSFPLNSDRKSGFLLPNFDYSSSGGFGIRQPYYWNIAPNFDMLVSPRIMSKRGVQLNDLIRYLNHQSYTEFYASFIPDDQAFENFKEDTLTNPPNTGFVNPQPYLDELQGDSDNRGYFSINNVTHFNPDWTAHVIGNYVTDAYYFRDFGDVYGNANDDQLLNQGDIEYSGNNWELYGMLQGFQTLHLITNAGEDVQSQYMRLPEFDFNANYPIFEGLDAGLSGQSVNFVYSSDFIPDTTSMPVGERVHLMPSLSRSFNWVAGYLTPQIALDSTTYDAEDAIIWPETTRTDVDASRNLPVADIDSGLYFQRNWHLGTTGFTQTLEPRLFYLYVPYQNQDQYPVFDTQLLAFSYDQLFSLNRFSGVDRLENANQVSMGLTSRFLNSYSSWQKIKMDLGAIYYFTPPKVCLNSLNCQNSTYNVVPKDADWSPIVTDLTYYPLPGWSLTNSYAYNPEIGRTDNDQSSINYSYDDLHILRAGYQYIRSTSTSTDQYGFSNNTKDVFSGVGWGLTEKLSALSYVFYNFSKERFDQYYAGLQYDTCCWALRTLVQRNWTGNTPNNNSDPSGGVTNQFDTVYTVQLELKSLGSFGTGSGKTLVERTIGGFSSPFER